MKIPYRLGLIFVLFSAPGVLAQEATPETIASPSRVVVTTSLPPPTRVEPPKPSPTPIVVGRPRIVNEDRDIESGASAQSGPAASLPPINNLRAMSFGQIKSKIAEAKRLMQSRPLQTASPDPALATSLVRVAFYDWRTQHVDFIVVSKDTFLSTDGSTQTISSDGNAVTLRTIRANGVNTPITLTDSTGEAKLPLLVQYPVERDGRFMETAYYMSTHPGLVTPEVVNAGRMYVRNVIEIARDRLNEKGIAIQPKIADIAERLATVEHVDHSRFRTEPSQTIFNDIFTLYALNESQTYRYSVSFAGAGGMVQMIPATYRMMRSKYPSVGLMPDFVEGMRNHVNATQAMLLYMQMTWNDLNSSPTVSGAMTSGIATQEQLMAAGYNSNPAKLAGYINRGGDGWATLIPRETKIYLQIYDSLQRYVPMTPRTR